MSGSIIKVLLVEDLEDDAVLLERELSRGGFVATLHRVETTEQLMRALNQPGWDIVITDHNLPGFSSEVVLQAVREKGLDVPVIILSGTIGEEAAVAAMKSGASDYIMKGNMARLGPAIERELRDAIIRRNHREAEATIRHMAIHDPLTGLSNRHAFSQRLADTLHSAREHHSVHGLLYLDLDQFKVVNDTCGHVAGDELLKQLALVLRQSVRDSDSVARLGGDEFGLLLENCPTEDAQRIASKLLHALNDYRFTWAGRIFSLKASIGLVPINYLSKTVEDLLGRADLACFAAKDLGRNRVHEYRDDDFEMARRHGEMQWVSQINHALEQNNFVLYQQRIQPLDVQSGAGHREILIRLRHEDGSLVSPGTFLPAAERYNLAPAVDRWVVRAVIEHLANPVAVGDLHDEAFFVNISGSTLNDNGFFDFVSERLRATGVRGSRLCFEITETAAISNLNQAVSFIEHIRAEGCQFALDDFGAGLSSFSYLKTIPVDFLKIDGGFVREIASDPMDRAIVEAINQIGHVVGLRTIAEFTETDAVRHELVRLGVDYAQGYGIHRPEPLS